MELNGFVAHFAEQFEDTEASSFMPETRFRELDEWSSFMGLNIIAMVDEEYDIVLKGDDIRKAQTIKDVFDIVCSKQ